MEKVGGEQEINCFLRVMKINKTLDITNQQLAVRFIIVCSTLVNIIVIENLLFKLKCVQASVSLLKELATKYVCSECVLQYDAVVEKFWFLATSIIRATHPNGISSIETIS